MPQKKTGRSFFVASFNFHQQNYSMVQVPMKLFFCGLVIVMLAHNQASAFSTDTLQKHCKSYADNDFQASHPDHNICISYVLGILDAMNFNCIYSRLASDASLASLEYMQLKFIASRMPKT